MIPVMLTFTESPPVKKGVREARGTPPTGDLSPLGCYTLKRILRVLNSDALRETSAD
jgi:hypothetical protein